MLNKMILDAIGELDDDIIYNAKKHQKANEKKFIKIAAFAACVCVIAAGVLILPKLTSGPIVAPVTSISETSAPVTYPPDADASDTDKSNFAAAPADENTVGNNSVEKHTLDDVVYNSYAFVFARCTGIVSNKDNKTEYRFDTVTHLAGEEMPKEFVVTALGTEEELLQMEEEHYYILPICKSISVFFDEYERYHLTSETLFETDNNGNIVFSKMQGNDINTGINNVDEFKAFLESSEVVCSQSCDDIGTKYSEADDLEGVCRDSDYILEVEVIDINTDFMEDRTSYDCRVLSEYKSIDDINEVIDITTTKGAMEIGQKYVIAINRVSKGSDMFVVSSRNRSVYPVNSSEAEKIIELSISLS